MVLFWCAYCLFSGGVLTWVVQGEIYTDKMRREREKFLTRLDAARDWGNDQYDTGLAAGKAHKLTTRSKKRASKK